MKSLRRTVCLILIMAGILPGNAIWAQRQKKDTPQKESVVIVDDEACGCELYFVNGIQTTQNEDGLFGFKREDGTVIVEPRYKFVDKFHGDYCIVFIDYEQCGLIDRDGNEILKPVFQEINYPTDGMIRVKQNELYGFYDTTGRLMIEPQYLAVSGFEEGLASVAVEIDSFSIAYGYIDHQNRMIIPPQFQYAYPFHEGYAVAKKYDRFGMIDHNGREVLTFKYDHVTYMINGVFWAFDSELDKCALFNNKFKPITQFVYDNVTDYTEGFFTVERNGKKTFVDTKGRQRFEYYDEVSGFIGGFSMVARDGHYGIINTRGKTILPMEYDNSGYRSMEYIFSEGLAMVEKSGRFGFVDKRGRIVIPIIYESAQHCTEGLIPVQKDRMWGFIDKEGNVFIDFIFDAASFFEWGRAEVVYNSEVFKINPEGRCVKNCKKFPKIELWPR